MKMVMTHRTALTKMCLLGFSRSAALVTCSVVLVFASATPALGQKTASWEELKNAIKAGDAVVVLAQDGRRFRADVLQVSNTALSLRTGTINEVLSVERVREVSVRRNDGVWNGLLIGTAAGALGGLIPDYLDDCKECHDSLYGSIAVGAAAGVIIDALFRAQTLVYRAPGVAKRLSIGVQTRGHRTAVVLSVHF